MTEINAVYAVVEYVQGGGYNQPVGFHLDREEAERIAQLYQANYKNSSYEVLEVVRLEQATEYFKAVADSKDGITVTRGVATYYPDRTILYSDKGLTFRSTAYGTTEAEAVTRVLLEFSEQFPDTTPSMKIKRKC